MFVSHRLFGVALAGLSTLGISQTRASVLYVDDDAPPGGAGTSWPVAHRYLQDALAAASASGGGVTEIRVAGGLYHPDQGTGRTAGDRTASFMMASGLSLVGGYAGLGGPDPNARDIAGYVSTLSGDLNDNDASGSSEENSYHVVRAMGVNLTATLDGFTIKGGYATTPWDSTVDNLGGGLLSYPGGPTVTRCSFIGNLGQAGGGAYCQGSPVFTDCVFRENQAVNTGGGVYAIQGTAQILRCTFVLNTADDAAGLGLREGPHLVTDCTFQENSARDLGGGLYLYDTNATVVNCRMIGNYAYDSGGGIYIAWRGDPQIINCLIVANRSGYGGGIYNWWNTTTITNCTIVANTAYWGNGVYQALLSGGNTVAYITNSILWSNGGTTSSHQSSSSATITNSLVQGGWAGGGGTVINADPQFRRNPDPRWEGWGAGNDDDYGDLRLKPGSPCLDQGLNSVDVDRVLAGVQPLPAVDLENLSRKVDEPIAPNAGTPPVVDLGAYEYQYDCNGNSIMDSVDLNSGTSSDCNGNGMPDECDPQDDCNGNSIADICDLASGTFFDCNENGRLDVCDIASGSSQDLDNNGVPDDCERSLTGYWRFDMSFDMTGCNWFDHFFDQVRYLRFDAANNLIENWILADGVYLKVNYPSMGGPSLNRYMAAGELTTNTERSVNGEFLSRPWRWNANEWIFVPSEEEIQETDAEGGYSRLEGRLDTTGTAISGTWEMWANWQFCGTFVATKVTGLPPDLPSLTDLEAGAMTLDTTTPARPGTINVSERSYRVNYSFLSVPVDVRYLLSTDEIADADDIFLGSETLQPDVDLGIGFHTGPGPALAIPNCVRWGQQQMILMVFDLPGALVETNENNNTVTVPVSLTPAATPGDFDGDCDVDGGDLVQLRSCRSGPDIPYTDPACGASDFDQDADVDQDDFAVLQVCYSGSGVSADPDCWTLPAIPE